MYSQLHDERFGVSAEIFVVVLGSSDGTLSFWNVSTSTRYTALPVATVVL